MLREYISGVAQKTDACRLIAWAKLPIIWAVENFGKLLESGRVALRIACTFIGIVAVTSCSSARTTVNFSPFHESIVEVAKKNVRTAKIYRDLDTILIADLLWYSPALKKAYLDEMKSENRVDEEGGKAKLREIEEKALEEIEFIAGIYTGEDKWNDLEMPRSIWKLRLNAPDGSTASPASIEKIDVDDMPDSHLFTFMTHWKTVYRITFKKTGNIAGVTNPTLKMYSILGKASFDWSNGSGG